MHCPCKCSVLLVCKWFLGVLPLQELCFVGPASGFWVLCLRKCSVLLALQVVFGCSALASALFCWSCKWLLGALPLQVLCFVGPVSGFWVHCLCKSSVLLVLQAVFGCSALASALFCVFFSTLHKTGYTGLVPYTKDFSALHKTFLPCTRLVTQDRYTRLVTQDFSTLHKTGTQDWYTRLVTQDWYTRLVTQYFSILHKTGTQDWSHNTFLSYTRLVHKTGHTRLVALPACRYAFDANMQAIADQVKANAKKSFQNEQAILQVCVCVCVCVCGKDWSVYGNERANAKKSFQNKRAILQVCVC